MTSSLGYAVLGLLARAPMTGYEISRRLRTPIGYFWTAQHSQIYTELARLERDGLAEHEVVDGPGPRDTKRYRATTAGRHQLTAWVVTDPGPVPVKSELLLRIYSIWLAAPEQALAMLERSRAAHRLALDRYQTTLGDESALVLDPTVPEFGDVATLKAGIVYERAMLEWFDWLAGTLGDATRSTEGAR